MGARTPQGDTTRRSAEPSDNRRSAPGVAIRWVHPSLELSLLHDGDVLGRDESCNTILPDEEVSRKHARVERRGLVLIITDLDSRNGVHINGVRQLQSPIGPGDVVRI